jgi:hypothetical protein
MMMMMMMLMERKNDEKKKAKRNSWGEMRRSEKTEKCDVREFIYALKIILYLLFTIQIVQKSLSFSFFLPFLP